MCKEKNYDGAIVDLVAKDAPIVLRVWHNGEGLQHVATAVGLLNLFWSTGVLEWIKSQTPSTKLQTNLKFQYQMTKTGLEF